MPTNYKYYLIPFLLFLFILTLGSGKTNQPPPQKPPGNPPQKPPSKSKSRGAPLVKLVQPGVEEYETNEPDGPDRVPDPPGSETSRWGTFDLNIMHRAPGSKAIIDFNAKHGTNL